jgi:hypothetical protein
MVSGWRNALMRVPLYVDTPEPIAPSAELMNPPVDPPDVTELAPRLLAAYNSERTRVQRAPITLDAGLMELARQRMAESLAAPQVGPAEDLLQRARATGCVADQVYEFTGRRGRSAQLADIVRDLLESPRIRSQLISEAVDRVGIRVERLENGVLAVHVVLTGGKPTAP